MMCVKKISWVIIIFAVSFFGCSNPTGDTTGPVSPRPTWEKLYVKFEVSGLVLMRSINSDYDNMIYHKYDGNWDNGGISFNSKIDSSWRDTNSDPPTEPFLYDTKEVVMNSQGWPWQQSLNVGVKGFSGGWSGDSRAYLIVKIYVKETSTDDYKLYAQKRGDRESIDANLEVVLTADLNDYR